MSSSILIDVFGHIVFSFTRGVTEHYNTEEPEFTAESFGYNPLESTGREWYCHPADEIIYQEYSDIEATSGDYPATRRFNVRVIDACSPEENEEMQENKQNEDSAMVWKRLRPSALRTVCKSMYIGALISLLAASIVGTMFMLVSYIGYKTNHEYCQFHSISDIAYSAFLYVWFFELMLFLFRPFQLKGVKRKLSLVSLMFCLDTLYIVALQALGISHSYLTNIQKIPLNVLFASSIALQIYILTIHFCTGSTNRKLAFFSQMFTPICLCYILAIIMAYCIYPAYNKQNREGKLLIALFAPLTGVVLTVISRTCVQQLRRTTHPGYSHVLLSTSNFTTAVMFRVLQADLDSLQSIAILGITHGAAEVIERSTMVVIDHICNSLWRRQSAPWGSFRTPRRERLMADIVVTSMLSESTAIVSVNGFLYLYQLIFLKNNSILKLLQSFAFHTSVPLVIEWFFNSVSLAIQTFPLMCFQ